MRTYHAGEGPILEVLFTADGKAIVCVEALNETKTSKAVRWISRDSGEVVRSLNVRPPAERWGTGDREPQIGDVSISPDGNWVAAQHYIGDPVLLHLWDGRTGKWKEIEPSSHHWFCIDAAAFSPDGKHLVYASGTDGGGTRALDRIEVRTKRQLSSIDFPGYSVRSLAFSPDRRRLAAITYPGALIYAYQRGPVEPRAPELKLEDEPGPIAFRPDGKELAILYGGDVLFWDGQSAEADTLSISKDNLEALCFSPDGRFLALACADHSVRFWDCQARRESQRFDWEIGSVSSLAFAPDGMTCGAGGPQGQVVVWDVND